MTEPRLFFLHVPKTAGVSVTHYLSSRYTAEEACIITDPNYLQEERRIAALPDGARARLRLVAGHFPYGFHDRFPLGEHVYFCLLRDPVERVASLYRYIRATPEHHMHERVAKGQMDLVTFAASGMHPELDNCQTRMLSGREESHWWAGAASCDDEDYCRATAHLREPSMILGLYEHLPQSIALLEVRMGWRPVELEQKNMTLGPGRAAQLCAQERAVIEAHNRFDCRLYADARVLFANAWRQVDLIRRARVMIRGFLG